MENKFCKKQVLRNESDVEQFFVIRLLEELGYKDKHIFTKNTISSHSFGKGNKHQNHKPDYLIKIDSMPVLVVEAKSPDKSAEKYISEAQEYSMVVNRGFIGENPIKYCLVTNGINTKLVKPDEDRTILDLDFNDFNSNNEKFKRLKKVISIGSLKKTKAVKEDSFEFKTPELDELRGILKQAHNLIRRKQKIGPKKAFYEFTKLLFIKMNEDKEMQEKIKNGDSISEEDFRFSTKAINRDRKLNPIITLFRKYRDELEEKVATGEKKRIFKKGEEINLSPSTIEGVVELIENFNLHSVEDDINGKVFETFLESAVRGKELGQFFTPRPVVKFMTKMANLKIKRNENGDFEPDKVLDGACGTGGFLIFALTDLFNKIPESSSQKKQLKEKIRNEALFGIDASEDDIVPITRMNMYLHGDGGSHIFLADTLDKEIKIEKGLDSNLKRERRELKKLLNSQKFDVVLTNPPFSMKYTRNKEDEKRILDQYEIANLGGKKQTSLNSNIMFIERYYDLLKPGGKLLTVIDESVLNSAGRGNYMKKFRAWLRDKFIIRAVISLPRNTFTNASTKVKTSVLYLTKKIEGEKQPKVFMAKSEDVGHTDAGKITSEWGDLGKVLKKFRDFQKGNH